MKEVSWFITNEGVDLLHESIFLYRKLVESRLQLEEAGRDTNSLIENEVFLKERIKTMYSYYMEYSLECR